MRDILSREWKQVTSQSNYLIFCIPSEDLKFDEEKVISQDS